MHPSLAPFFAYAHVICWPYLWVQLQMLLRRCRRERRAPLIAVSRWGKVTIVAWGDRWADPSVYTYTPPARRWDDPQLAMAMPVGRVVDKRIASAATFPPACNWSHDLHAPGPMPDPG